VRGRASRLAVLLLALLVGNGAAARDIQRETRVAFAGAGADESQGQAVFSVRSPESSAACPDGLLRLPLDSETHRLLYSLLLSAHFGERIVSLWSDLDDGCRITQGQLHD